MRLAAAGLAIVLAATPLAAQEAEPAALPGWMAGAWQQQRDGGAWADEFWTPPRAGVMLGAARIGKGDKLSIFEHTRIVTKADGGLVFVAQPLGRSPAEFPMVARGEAMIEFANADHDYPQRIRYWKADGRLYARISLFDGSKPQNWDYGRMGGGG